MPGRAGEESGQADPLERCDRVGHGQREPDHVTLAAGLLGLQPPYIPDNGSENWNSAGRSQKGDPVLYDLTPTGGQNLFMSTEGKGNPNIADQVYRTRLSNSRRSISTGPRWSAGRLDQTKSMASQQLGRFAAVRPRTREKPGATTAGLTGTENENFYPDDLLRSGRMRAGYHRRPRAGTNCKQHGAERQA
ncbi:MAG: hypothetical protein IPG62_15675 [Sphingomonadales bacterium]|nr:hypothetical protein [Sphingomonadales bacterium]